MPNNQLPGMLEYFVIALISPDDQLYPKAETILQKIEEKQLNPYNLIHHSKALIHTWLAWRSTPGMPIGQAITAQVLQYNNPIALNFITWLKHLQQGTGNREQGTGNRRQQR